MIHPTVLRGRSRAKYRVLAVVLVLLATYLVSLYNPPFHRWVENTMSIGGTQPSRATGAHSPVIVAAGDIACSAKDHVKAGPRAVTRCAETLTSNLAISLHPTAVLPLGDNEYDCGRAGDFAGSYAKTWGRLLKVTHPVVGNHEYGRICHDNEAAPYFNYFGDRAGPRNQGWYSYDVGSWHMIALNSECTYGKGPTAVGGCAPGDPQYTWLQADLKAHTNACTLAYWHEPRFSSGEHGDSQSMTPIWNALVAAHVDVVLNGHNHDYERFTPLGTITKDSADRASTTTGKPNFQDPNPDPNGIRQFVVGTGGKNHYAFGHAPLKGEVVRNADTFGVLVMDLHPDSYDFRFQPINEGGFTDSGSGLCH